jgi:aminocarboxymuconate-semialdehyde decarboxylase
VTTDRQPPLAPVPVVDVHAHALVLPAHELALAEPAAAEARAVEAATFGAAAMDVNRRQIDRILPLLTELDPRLGRMDRMGVDVQLVSPSPQHYHEWADAATSARLSRVVNEGVAELCARRPDRLVGLGLVPLHHPALAAGELTHAVTALGLRGVEISTSAGGRELSDPALEPFWARAEELGALVFIHPWGCTLGHRLDEHYLANVVGQPVETTLALSHLIFSGLLDRRPGLRILAAHGGGYLPYYTGRSDHAWEVRADARTPQRRPSEYLRRLYFDGLVYDPQSLAALIARVGAGQVMLGTDYPFDMGVEDPLDRLAAVPGLPRRDAALIRGGTAAALLGIPRAPAPAAAAALGRLSPAPGE